MSRKYEDLEQSTKLIWDGMQAIHQGLVTLKPWCELCDTHKVALRKCVYDALWAYSDLIRSKITQELCNVLPDLKDVLMPKKGEGAE